MRERVGLSKLKQIRRAINEKDLDSLRTLALSKDGFLKDSFRTEAWMLLLHCESGIFQHLKYVDLDEATERQIQLDVDRSFVHYQHISSKNISRFRSALKRLTSHVFRCLPWLHYYQGFHDICSVLLMVLGEYRAKRAALVLSAVWLREFMEPTMESTMSQVSMILLVLKQMDPELHSFFQSIPDFQPIFSVSWLITWLSHDLDKFQGARLFDALIATNPLFIIYLACALLKTQRSLILECDADMADVHGILCHVKFQELDFENLIQETVDFYDRYPNILQKNILPYSASVYFKESYLKNDLNFKNIEQTVRKKLSKPTSSLRHFIAGISIIGIIGVYFLYSYKVNLDFLVVSIFKNRMFLQ
ncbi:rab-GTPase-TBC domain-containing protein [Globomyces pollinis-pini]|nr:rab-GTPase-TBC domain-containing protein [Globomyces pollinis-pini]